MMWWSKANLYYKWSLFVYEEKYHKIRRRITLKTYQWHTICLHWTWWPSFCNICSTFGHKGFFRSESLLMKASLPNCLIILIRSNLIFFACSSDKLKRKILSLEKSIYNQKWIEKKLTEQIHLYRYHFHSLRPISA